VNASVPLSFILDSGASYSVISLRKAKSFDMAMQPVGRVEGGIGAQPPDAYLVTDDMTISLPGVEFSGHHVVAMSLDSMESCGLSADGVLGQDFFEKFVVQIDYRRQRISLSDPQMYEYTGAGEILPIQVESHIYVTARVKAADGQPFAKARFVVDTGAGTALSLAKEFTDAHHLLPPRVKLAQVADCGIGGHEERREPVGRVALLRLGKFRVRNASTMFYRTPGTPWADGLLGSEALLRFTVIFDCARHRMILERG